MSLLSSASALVFAVVIAPANPTAPGSTAAPPGNAAGTSFSAAPAALAPTPAQGPVAPPSPTISSPPPSQPPPAGLGLAPPPAGLPPAPFFLRERSYFDLFVLRREDFLRWQAVPHVVYGIVIEPRPTTTTTLEFTKGPLRPLVLTMTGIHGAVDSPGLIRLRAGITVPGTHVSLFGDGGWIAGLGRLAAGGAGVLSGRRLGVAGRF